MPITFKEETRSAVLLDPFSEFATRRREVQIREDPLTGARTRLFNYRRRPPQQADRAANPDQTVCAFCRENIEAMTPLFPPDLCPEGRIRRGEAVAFPNLFPYETHNAVVAISERHEVPMVDWSPEVLADALLASRDYVARVKEFEGGERYYSINWNYTPVAGASQVHPHLQVLVSDQPTFEQARLLRASREYSGSHGANYWEDLIRSEQAAGQRYVGHTGEVAWLVNFAPRGFVPDVTAVLGDNADFTACGDGEIRDLARGLVKVFNYYGSRIVRGANLTLYSITPGRSHFRTHLRLLPRLRIPPLDISDVNYFKLMHDEAIALFPPEQVCEELKPYFL
jgi:galactose-1-phosphate uridylyltransferase